MTALKARCCFCDADTPLGESPGLEIGIFWPGQGTQYLYCHEPCLVRRLSPEVRDLVNAKAWEDR